MARSPSINKVTIAGNIVRDPKVRKVGEKKISVANFTVANNRPYLDKDKNWQEETAFVDAELWSMQAEKVGDKAKKRRSCNSGRLFEK